MSKSNNSAMRIQVKTEDLLNKTIYPIIKNFPKSERFAICQEIKNSFYKLLTNIILASQVKIKRQFYLSEADAYHKLILVLMSVSYEQKYITQKKFLQIQEELYEVGKMLGGWMKKRD